MGRDWNEDDERECFQYVLPVTFLMPDGSTITVEDEEGWYSLRVWYEENRGYEEEPSIQYPIDISQETEEGSITVTLLVVKRWRKFILNTMTKKVKNLIKI